MRKNTCTSCRLGFESKRRCSLCSGCRKIEKRKLAREAKRKLKLEMIGAYGGKCQCPGGCEISDPEFLTIGHIRNDGAAHRKKVGGAGAPVYADLKKRGWPKDGYRLECFLCNLGAAYSPDKLCPHVRRKRVRDFYSALNKIPNPNPDETTNEISQVPTATASVPPDGVSNASV